MMEAIAHLAEAGRLYVLIALVLAAWGKSIGFARFRETLAESFPGMGNAAASIALAIVSAEWSIAGMLLGGGAASRAGLAAALALFSLFAAVIAWSLIQDRAIVCSCFGTSSHRISIYDLIRNLLFICASAFALRYLSPATSIEPVAEAALAGIAIIVLLLSTALQDIALLLRAKTGE